jgi:hypothetical protein
VLFHAEGEEVAAGIDAAGRSYELTFGDRLKELKDRPAFAPSSEWPERGTECDTS